MHKRFPWLSRDVHQQHRGHFAVFSPEDILFVIWTLLMKTDWCDTVAQEYRMQYRECMQKIMNDSPWISRFFYNEWGDSPIIFMMTLSRVKIIGESLNEWQKYHYLRKGIQYLISYAILYALSTQTQQQQQQQNPKHYRLPHFDTIAKDDLF